MPRSNVARGAYYKAKTKRWLEARGYQVMDAEIVRWIWRPGGQRIPMKRDQLASDLIAVSARNVIFVQVKGGDRCHIGHFPEARRKFEAFTFPPWVRRWVIAWPTGSREPRIVKMEARDGEASADRKGLSGRTTRAGETRVGQGALRDETREAATP